MGVLTTAGSLLSVGTSMASVVYKLGTGGIKLASTVLNSKAGRMGLIGGLGLLAFSMMTKDGVKGTSEGLFSALKETVQNVLNGGAKIAKDVVQGVSDSGKEIMEDIGLKDSIEEHMDAQKEAIEVANESVEIEQPMQTDVSIENTYDAENEISMEMN